MASSAPLGELTHVAGRSSAGPQRLYGVVGRRVAAPEEGERKGLLRKPPADGPMGALTRPDTRRDLVGVLLYDIMPTVAWEPPVCI